MEKAKQVHIWNGNKNNEKDNSLKENKNRRQNAKQKNRPKCKYINDKRSIQINVLMFP